MLRNRIHWWFVLGNVVFCSYMWFISCLYRDSVTFNKHRLKHQIFLSRYNIVWLTYDKVLCLPNKQLPSMYSYRGLYRTLYDSTSLILTECYDRQRNQCNDIDGSHNEILPMATAAKPGTYWNIYIYIHIHCCEWILKIGKMKMRPPE